MKTIGPGIWIVNVGITFMAELQIPDDIGPDRTLGRVFSLIDAYTKTRHKQLILSPETKPNPRGFKWRN